jgi:hypothetical protein
VLSEHTVFGVASAPKPIKISNAPTIWGVLIADALLAYLTVNGLDGATSLDSRALAVRAVAAVFAPAVALLLGSVIPASGKDVLVFWRFRNALPGHRALHYAKQDPRIDVARLERHVASPFPADPREQNAFWYRLYKTVEGEPNVDQCNRMFLLLRELAAISIVACFVTTIVWLFTPGERLLLGVAALIFGGQYALAALGAAWNGKRLVTTVLAAHSAKRRT